MKIWLINHYACEMFFHKGGRHYWFANELKKRGHDVVVICSAASAERDENYTKTISGKFAIEEDNGIPYIFVKNKPYSANGFDRIENMGRFFFNLFPTSKQLIKRYGKPDIILASSVHPLTMVAGVLISRRIKIPCVCEIRDLWPEAIFAFGRAREDSLLGRALLIGEHWIYRNADALIFTKEGDTDYLLEKKWATSCGGDIDLEKCFYINNGILLEQYNEQIKTSAFPDEDLDRADAFNVVYTGTIRPVNNLGNILDCAKLFQNNAEYRNVSFLIYGDGSDKDMLEKRVEEEGINNVHFKGAVEKCRIPYILSKAKVNLLNYSQTEYNWRRGNSSNKLFEYMASGKPIISTVQMGYSIINKYKCGIELETCTPECLFEAIKRFILMPKEEYDEYSIAGKDGAKDFDFVKHTDRLLNVVKYAMEK